MTSGIVYFDEIVQDIKDATGIENLRPLYPRIKRFVFKVEQDIGAGSLMVLKTKSYTKGDGLYNGLLLKLPEDFLSEWSYGALDNGTIQGNVFELTGEGPDEVDLKYLGMLLDENGYPFTTRNRLEAVVNYAVYRLYGNRYFLGKGNRQQYEGYKFEYDNAVMMARGNDAYPSEKEWCEIGAILRAGTFEALTDCGMRTINAPSVTGESLGGEANSIVYYWQYTHLVADISFAPGIDQDFLDTKDSQPIQEFIDGYTITYSEIGRIGLAITNVDEDAYQIIDVFETDITEVAFDTYYNSTTKTQIYITKTHYSHGNIYYKLIKN